MPLEITSSTRLQTLQYQIVHKYFPTRRYLYSREVVDDRLCDDCGQVDSLYHHFFECHEIVCFSIELISKISGKLPRQRQLKMRKDVLFSIQGQYPVINLVLLIAKQFLASQRYRDGSLTYEAFYPTLVKMFSIQKKLPENGKTEKFVKNGKPFTSADGLLLDF